MSEREEPLLDDERLFQGMLRTPLWKRMRRALQYRRDRAAERLLRDVEIAPERIAADRREWSILNELIADPVKFLTELQHSQQLDGWKGKDDVDEEEP